jgi:hypothetical protein
MPVLPGWSLHPAGTGEQLMALHEGSRVLLKLLDGIRGTVTRLPDAEHVTVLADGSGQPVRWRRDEVIELDEGES